MWSGWKTFSRRSVGPLLGVLVLAGGGLPSRRAWAQATPVAESGAGRNLLLAASALGARSMHQNGIRFRVNRQQALALARRLVQNNNARVRVANGLNLSQRVTQQMLAQWEGDTQTMGAPMARPGQSRSSLSAEQEPGSSFEPESETGPFEITLMIENDNILFGIYALMAGTQMDGTDFGRTHGMTLSASYGVARGIRLGLDLDTVLYTEAVDPEITRASGGGRRTIPIRFNELNQIRFRMDWADPNGGPWRIQLVGGVVIQNRAGMSYLGGTGQQALWHEIGRASFSPNLWNFELVPDGGGIVAGPFAGVRGGVEGLLGNRWIRLRARAMAGAEFTSLPHGSYAAVTASTQLEIGPPDMFHAVIGIEQEFDVFLTSGAVTGTTRAMVRLASEPFDFWFTMNFYELDPNLLYTLYNFNNSTMTAGLTVRF